MSQYLLEESINKMLNESLQIGKSRYAPYLESASQAYYNQTGRQMPTNLQSTLVRNLMATQGAFESAGYDVQKYIKEESTPDSIGQFIHHAFDMVTAIIPSSIIEEFATIQGMDKRIGEIFYMDIIKGTTKGSSTKGDNYLSSQFGPQTGEDYSDERINLEPAGTGDGGTTAFTGTAKLVSPWSPYKTGTVIMTFTIGAVVYTATDGGSGAFAANANIASSVIDYTNGTVSVTFNTAPDNLTKIYLSYSYASTTVGASGLPEVDVKLTNQLVTAKRRALKTKWLLDTAAMLSKEHGKDIEKELLDAVVAGVMNEIAVECANDIYNVANAGLPVQFTKTPPSPQIPFVIHRQELLASVVQADVNIESAVRKVKANFVIAGSEFTNIVRAMPVDLFKPASYADATPVGMHVIGTLNNQYKIIQNFDFASTAFVVGAKGNNWLTTGYVYAPFIPLMTTRPITDENLVTFRSLLTYYGKQVVNSSFFNKGVIVA